MKYVLISFCLCLGIILPGTTPATLTGEVIFTHPEHFDELWITHVEDTSNARRIFRDTVEVIEKFSVQKGGPLLVFISFRGIFPDVHLLDRTQTRRKARNLTKGLFDGVSDVAISKNGDVVFTTGFLEPPEAQGIYLIPNRELKRNLPAATLLKRVSAFRVEWAPNGEEIAYSTNYAVFLLNLLTRESLQISREGTAPAFSPDGKKIAFAHAFRHEPRDNHLSIVSLATLQPLARIKVKALPDNAAGWFGLSWSPDGQYLIYTTFTENFHSFHNTAVPIAGGPQERIFEGLSPDSVPEFDWTHTAYAVKPTNRLTTLWGKLKQHNFK